MSGSGPVGDRSPDFVRETVLEGVFELQQELQDPTMAPNRSGTFAVTSAMPIRPHYPPELANVSREMNSVLRGIKSKFDATVEDTRKEIFKLKRKREDEDTKYLQGVAALEKIRKQIPGGISAEADVQRELCRLRGLKDAEDSLVRVQLDVLNSVLESSVRQQDVLLSLMIPHIIVEEAQMENQ